MQLPLAIVQRTDIPCLEPTGDTMEMESVLCSPASEVPRSGVVRVATHVTDTPGSIAFLTTRSHLVGLTINAWITSGQATVKVRRPTNRDP